MIKMTKILKDKWIESLTLGYYKQGRGLLRKNRGNDRISYCCLGVLNDLAGRVSTSGYYLSNIDSNHIICDKNLQDILVIMNDDEKKSFSEIAEYIKKNTKIDKGILVKK